MKKAKNMEDMRNKTEGELEALLGEEREKLAQVKLKIKAGQEQNRSLVGKSKLTIAHILTAMKELTLKEVNLTKDA